jgi:hypothetical protein
VVITFTVGGEPHRTMGMRDGVWRGAAVEEILMVLSRIRPVLRESRFPTEESSAPCAFTC